jgi:tyrosyl-tRNA synthetase
MTYKPRSDFLHIMESRGYLQDCTDLEGLDKRLLKKTIPAYIGFDATADSLHVGSLIQIMILRWLQKTGHKPITLMGGGTTKIGDPSGKDQSRKLLTTSEIDQNISGIRTVFDKYLKFGDGKTDAIQPNNSEWLENLNYIDFLRDYGRHFTINRMLSFDSVRLRLEREQPLTFLEFNYMLLQAYDFMELNKRYDCELQLGGSDQWGNIVNGIDLTRRINKSEVFGFTTPLLTKADGSKMGKSADGAIWLNNEKLEPYLFWQFWRNTMDEDVGKFLKLFTELPIDECEKLEKLNGSEINHAKQVLATEITALAHGRNAALNAEKTAKNVFDDGSSNEGLPTIFLSEEELLKGITIAQLFTKSGLSRSGKDAKRLIVDGGAKINDQMINDPSKIYFLNEISEGIKLSAGKKRHSMVKIK